MPLELKINGNANYDWIRESVNIQETVQARGSTLSVHIQINAEAQPVPQCGHVVLLTETGSGTRHFGGRVATCEEQEHLQGGDEFLYELTCVDFTIDFDFELIQHDFIPVGATQSAQDVARELVGRVGRGFTSNNVVGDVQVGQVRGDLDPPSQIISQLSESIEHQWYIDYNRDLHFFFVRDVAGPIPFVDFDVDTEHIRELVIEENWEQVKNHLFLDGAKSKSSNTDNIKVDGDGTIKFIPLNYEPWDLASFTVTVNAIPQVILLDGIDGVAGDGQGAAGEVYLCIDNWGMRFPDNFPVADGDPIDISYSFGENPIIEVIDPVSIALLKLREDSADAPSTGEHQIKFRVPEIRVDDEQDIWNYGQLLLQRYAKIVKVVTFSSWTQGWERGQVFTLKSARRNFDAEVFIHTVNKRLLDTTRDDRLFEYVMTGSTSFFPL